LRLKPCNSLKAAGSHGKGIRCNIAYNPLPTLATGDTWSAANANIYWKDNFAAGVPDIFTAAGDIAYATAANAAAPLAIGTPGQALLSSSDSLPVWGSVISNRQGGDATDCTIPGTTNFIPTLCQIQTGTIEIPKFNTTYGFITVTFPVAFANKPQVYITNIEFNGLIATALSITATTFQANYMVFSGGDPINVTVDWLAIYNP
jgi:hypothetical protein